MASEQAPAIDANVHRSMIRPWLNRTKWAQHLNGIEPRTILSAASWVQPQETGADMLRLLPGLASRCCGNVCLAEITPVTVERCGDGDASGVGYRGLVVASGHGPALLEPGSTALNEVSVPVDVVRARLVSLAPRREGTTGMDPMARHSERNSLASHAMSASAQDGASGKRRISVKDGANSCACPGVSTKLTNRPAASRTPTILVPRPPRERPSASSRLGHRECVADSTRPFAGTGAGRFLVRPCDRAIDAGKRQLRFSRGH